MELTLADLAERLNGEAEGDLRLLLRGVAGIREAAPGDVTFLANPKYEQYLLQTRASAVIVARDVVAPGKNLIRTDNPYLAYQTAVHLFRPARARAAPGIHPTAVLARGVTLGREVSIGPNVVVEEGASIGDRAALMAGVFVGAGTAIGGDCVIYPNVTIREDSILGERVVIHSGTVVGSDGFGYVRNGDRYEKIPQMGNVAIEDDVEIGANVAIDRATTGTTRIGRGTRIDNLVQIAHNVEIGENTIIVAQVGISGSTRVGNGVMLAGQVGLVGHIAIGDGARVGAQSGVAKDIPPGATFSGSPAVPHDLFRRIFAVWKKLPEIYRVLRDLEKRVGALEASTGNGAEEAAPVARERVGKGAAR